MKSRAVLGAKPAPSSPQPFHASMRTLHKTVMRELHITEDYFGTNAWTNHVNSPVEVNTRLKSLMKEQSYQLLLDVEVNKMDKLPLQKELPLTT